MTAILRYHGGKVRLASRIASLLPPHHEVYVEPFAGGAAVLLAKPRARFEVYNDLDGEMVNLFQVIRDHRDDLCERVALTPFARAEHVEAYRATDDAIERARRTLIRSHMGFGTNGIHKSTGFRAKGLRAGALPVHGWAGVPEAVRLTAERMRGVVIENRPALQVMAMHDNPDAVFYVDPPYLPETRERACRYTHEMSWDDHAELLGVLLGLKGRVVLSGYSSHLYDKTLAGWRRIEIKAKADGAKDRTEVLWLNFADILSIEGRK